MDPDPLGTFIARNNDAWSKIPVNGLGNALGSSLAYQGSSSTSLTFDQDMDERTAANPLLAAMQKQNHKDLAVEILAAQAAGENQSSRQDNGYPTIPYSPGDLASGSSFPGVKLGGFMGGGANTNGLVG